MYPDLVPPLQQSSGSATLSGMSAPLSLATRLRTLRLEAGLTLEKLAELSGVSARTLSDIERGVSVAPHRRTADAIATGLGLGGPIRDAFLRTARARRQVAGDGGRASVVTPHRVADFTGRRAEVAEVLAALRPPNDGTSAGSPRVVVIAGPPGMGKTTCALEAMSRLQKAWPRVVFVDLDGFNTRPLTALEALRALLRQLPGYDEKVPSTLEAALLLWQEATAENPVAVLLDNAAHEAQIRPVLAGNAGGVIAITSRRSLAGLEGAARVTLGPLLDEDSVSLLTRLIPAAQRQDNDLAELARLSDHIPLALRIVGNRIASRPAWSASDFARRMRSEEDRLRLLVAGDLAVESAFALSYNDLEPQTADLFRAIAVIDGSTFDARMAAAAADADVLDTELRLDELVDLGLLEARGGARYRLHDLARLFALDRLRDARGADGVVALRQHLNLWLLGSLERAGAWYEPDRSPELSGAIGTAFPDSDTASAWIKSETAHWWSAFQAVAAQGEHALIADIADSVHWFSDIWLEWGHWHDFFSLAVDASRALGDSRLEATHLGYVSWTQIVEWHDYAAALDTALLARAAAEASGDDTQIGWANVYVGWSTSELGQLDESAAAARLAVAAFTRAGYIDGATQATSLLANVLVGRGQHELALDAYRDILAQLAATAPVSASPIRETTTFSTHFQMSRALQNLGRPLEAVDSATAAVAVAYRLGGTARVMTAHRRRATAYIAAGNLTAARADVDLGLAAIRPDSTDRFLNKERDELELLRAQLNEREGDD